MWYWPYANWQGGVGYATANKVVQAVPVVTLPATGGNNIVILIGLALVAVLAPVFYLLQRRTV
jgi:LPXTG-motif cell wall-anchored protein